MAIRAVVFDLGGVLEQEMDAGVDSMWEARLGLKEGELVERFLASGLAADATLGKLTEQEWLEKIGALYRMKEQQVQEFVQDVFWEHYQLNGELASFFSSLRPQYKTAILSNAWPGARREKQRRFPFDEITDLIIYSYEVKAAKPEPIFHIPSDPRIFHITCERLDVQPAEMVLLDNLEPIVTAARDVGIYAIRFQETAQVIADIQAALQTGSHPLK